MTVFERPYKKGLRALGTGLSAFKKEGFDLKTMCLAPWALSLINRHARSIGVGRQSQGSLTPAMRDLRQSLKTGFPEFK